MRAYFAPVNRQTQTPAVFDMASQAGFNLDAPPPPWIDLGWVNNFSRRSLTRVEPVLGGAPGALLGQVRTALLAEVSLEFQSWTKLGMALAAGSQHMNVIEEGATPAAVGEGSSAQVLNLSPGDAAALAPGQIIVVDADYGGQTGFLGSPIAAAYLSSPLNDVNYLRRVSFNVSRVSTIAGGTVQLATPLPGGAPAAGARLQPVVGFMDREGGSFFPEWSALFVEQGEMGERIFLCYPRLQPAAGAAEGRTALAGRLEHVCLAARWTALPVTDATDGEPVLCYRGFLPAPSAQV
jgi:hypothetical protein